jgi:glycosyltransferase involved in cell wall biosynthesis
MPIDETLEADIPANVEVHRVSARQPFGLFKLLRRLRLDYLRELLFVPDSAIFWISPVVKLGQKIAARRRIDVIYTSVKPHSVAIAGWLLKRRLGKPWVIDFRDPWTQYFLAEFPTRLHYRIEQMLERFLLRRADHIVTITPTARAQLLQWCSFLTPEKVTVITNGYDDEDFDRASKPAVERNGSFSFVYSGVFCGAPRSGSDAGNGLVRAWRGLRKLFAYSPRAFDRLTHSPKFLLDALSELFRENPALRGRVKLIHIGPFDESNREYVRELGIPDAVEARGYVTHREAVDVVSKADALFFCLADSLSGERNDCVPQKVYEYLGSRRPVLALAPVGDARDFLNQAGTAIICSPRDLSEIKAGILSLLDSTDRLKPNEDFIRSFRRRELTRQLASVFDRVSDG